MYHTMLYRHHVIYIKLWVFFLFTHVQIKLYYREIIFKLEIMISPPKQYSGIRAASFLWGVMACFVGRS